jgi:prepilin signal peptidase PulO-like enzyme (type II secretory pathway)
MASSEKNPKSIRLGAFVLSAINLLGTVIGLLTTDTDLLLRRVKAVYEFFIGKSPQMADGSNILTIYQQVWPVYFVLSILFVLICYYELKHKKIPHIVTIPGILLGIALTFVFQQIDIWSSIGGMIGALVVFGGIFWMSKGKALGFGVVMMEAMLGAFFGPIALIVINVITVFIAMIYYYLHHHERLRTIEIGPLLSLAAALYFLASVVTVLL